MFDIQKFEQALKTEYARLNALNFLPDGKVDYAALCARLTARQGFSQMDIDDSIQELKESKLGMISMSRGHEKTWIEIRSV